MKCKLMLKIPHSDFYNDRVKKKVGGTHQLHLKNSDTEPKSNDLGEGNFRFIGVNFIRVLNQ